MTKLPFIPYMMDKPCIISAGMMRSASTVLFNTIRFILEEKWGDQLVAGWQNDIHERGQGSYYLVKTHNLSLWDEIKAEHIFYSYRDIRTAMVSAYKVWNTQPHIGVVEKYIDEYQRAKERADLMLPYGALIQQLPIAAMLIANILEIEIYPNAIAKKVLAINTSDNKPPYDRTTLFAPDHRKLTRDDEWREVLPQDLQNEISGRFGWWFKECGYPTE